MSSVGLGTYLGDADDLSDTLYSEAFVWAVNLGCNVVDAAANYRCQRSERVIGQTLTALIREGRIRRDQIVLATKGGLLAFDDRVPPDPQRYIRNTYMQTGLIGEGELVAGCHCIAPSFLRDQIERSLANLGVECIDVYYLQNPETQLQEVGADEFRARMAAAFAFLESEATAGRIGYYGLATWNGYRRTKRAREYVSLAQCIRTAEDVGGTDHRFRFVQLPYNLAMVEARTLKSQDMDGKRVSFLEAARCYGITVVSSASILQGQLVQLPADVAAKLPGLRSDTQRAIQFVRSTPGVTTALVGMRGRRHVEENLSVARVPPDPQAVAGLLARAA
jgi:aryl-alcohol dehydrogenase-like predicted oxidoreductase